MADREQTRRGAERQSLRQMIDRDRDSREPARRQAAEVVSGLLAELEQAERERDEARADYEGLDSVLIFANGRIDNLESRLAKVPELVEALTTVLEQGHLLKEGWVYGRLSEALMTFTESDVESPHVEVLESASDSANALGDLR